MLTLRGPYSAVNNMFRTDLRCMQSGAGGTMNWKRISGFLPILLLTTLPALAQTTANLTGTATADGAPIPGVMITITSPNLQGSRTASTDINGNYNFTALPPGDYAVRFEMEGMQAVNRTVRVSLAQTARADAAL